MDYVGTRGGVGRMRGPCGCPRPWRPIEDRHEAQYISLTLFKHNNCSTFLRSNCPLSETILMNVSGVSEMYSAQGSLSSSTLPPVPTREQHLPVEGSKGVEIVCTYRPFCAGCYAIH